MSRKPYVLALALLLGATACGRAESAQIDLGSGVRFVAEVVDPLNDAGRFPAVVTTSDGRPLVAYFGLAEDLPEGEIADVRPIGAPTVPGVLLATRNADGVWSRGAIALAAAIPNVDIAFAPAFDDTIAKLTPGTVSGLDLAIDGQDGLHAVWGSVDGLWYATGSSDPASTMPWSVEKIFDSPPEGLSLAVGGTGDPYISFISGGELRSAEGGPGAWRVNDVAPASACADGCGTDTAIVDGAPAIAFVDPTGSVSLATTGEAGWTAEPLAPGSWPSLTADGASPVVAFTGEGAVLAAKDGGSPVEVATIEGGPLGTSVAVDRAGTVSVAWATDLAGLGFAQGDLAPGGGFDPVATGTFLGAASPDVIAAPDAGGVFLTWQETSNRDLLLGSLGEGEFAFALPSPTIEPKRDTGMPTGAPTNCTPAEGGVATVVAEGVAFTDGSCISVPAGEPFQILFDDRDDAAALGQHNIAIFPSANDLANPLFRGDLVSGPAKATYDVDALDAGQYFFHCDVHPQMTGQVVAEGAGGGGGGAAGGAGATTSSIVAMGLAFDTATVNLPAGKATTLTFDNQDAGVPHNLAIYPSSSDLANPLFRGETFSGVATKDYEIPALEAGEYYFQCDVHPTMNGTVVVA